MIFKKIFKTDVGNIVSHELANLKLKYFVFEATQK
jgi:hypothetical protein